jgi:formylglycine-generating enzyme required for sulfatase activity
LRGYDGVTFTDSTSPATVSDFRLDKYEITVGRFRKFVAAWVAGWRPAYGTGKHMHLNGGSGLAAGAGYEGGWDAAWSLDMGTTSGDWNVKLSCDATFQTWTTAPGSNETRPVNCANWYEQHAFCIWDGGFLPSEAEWNYAAAGGSEQRVYPWGAADPGANASRAVFGCYYNGAGACSGVVNIAPVGSASAGDGKYGQSDLGGNIEEWTLDPFGLYPKPCTNCINATASSFRVAKDGSFAGYAYAMAASWHVGLGQADRYNALGARCARTP